MRKHRAILKGKVWEEYWEMSTPQESLVSDGYFCNWSSGYLLERLNKSQELYYMSRTTPSKKHRVKSYEEFWVGELSVPLLEVGEKLFVADMGVEVTVEDRVRTTEGNTCIYLVDYDIGAVSSENTKESKEYVKKEIEDSKEKLRKSIAELDKKIENLEEEFAMQREKYEKSGLISWLKKLIGRS